MQTNEPHTQHDETGKAGGSGRGKLAILVIGTLAIFFLGYYFKLGERLNDVTEWIETLGFWGPIAFIVVYTLATVAALPGLVLTIAGGAIFGAFFGTIWVSIGSTLGAAICFLIARYLARDPIASWLSDVEAFNRLDRLTEQNGDIMVAITRLVPIFPFNLINYGFGLTGVPFGTYFFWSWLCMLPGTIVYVAGTAAIKEALAEGSIPWALVGAVVVMIVILTLVIRRARRVLKQREAAGESDAPAGQES